MNKSAIFTHKRQSLNALLKSLMVFLFIASFCFVGCEKEVEMPEIDPINQETPLVLPKTKLKNGILYFNSIKEAQEAYEIISIQIIWNPLLFKTSQ